MERYFVYPVFHVLLLVGRGQKEKFRAVGAFQSKYVFSLRVVVGFLTDGVEYVYRSSGGLARLKVVYVLEEAQQLAAQNWGVFLCLN